MYRLVENDVIVTLGVFLLVENDVITTLGVFLLVVPGYHFLAMCLSFSDIIRVAFPWVLPFLYQQNLGHI